MSNRIKEVPKTGKNTKQNYSFRSIDDVLATYKVVMEALGICCYPVQQTVVDYRVDQSPDGRKTTTRVLLSCKYRFVSAHDGSCVDVEAVGEGCDYGGDKASYKAMSGAQKYALTQALSMPCDGFDPERTDFEPGNAPEGR